MSPPPDVLELLLPETSPLVMERARRLTTFLRLLAADARGDRSAGARTVRANLERARDEYEHQTRGGIRAALRDLLRHHLRAAAGPDSFLWCGEVQGPAHGSWSLLEEHREEQPWLPAVPAPGETALGVAARLLAAGERAGMRPGALSLWLARLRRVEHGVTAGEEAFRSLLKHAGSDLDRSRALAGLVECLLDRCAVPAARGLLGEHATLVQGEERLRLLDSWTKLVSGEPGVREAAPVAARPAVLPTPLGELRDRRSDWLPYLPGRRAAGSAGPDASTLVRSRADVGAVLLGVFGLRPEGHLATLHLDVAPALAGRVDAWLAGREGAWRSAGEPEHRLVARAETVIEHRSGAPLRGVLSPESVASLALVPIAGADGEVAGWLRIESEHHLQPGLQRLSQLARAWRAAVLDPVRARDWAPQQTTQRALGDPDGPDGPDPRARVYGDLIERLGMKLAQRRWWGFEAGAGPARLVARGGVPGRDGRGGRRALRRALLTGATVSYEERDAQLSVDGESASGVVVPVLAGDRRIGALCVESARRRDFPSGLVERLERELGRAADRLRVAGFRAWLLEGGHHDVVLGESERTETLLEEVAAGARARSPAVVWGPPGCGKRVVARWLQHEAGGALRKIHFVSCGPRAFQDPVGEAQREPGTTIVVDGLDRLGTSGQQNLLELLAGDGPSGPRWIVTCRRTPAELARANGLLPDLARRLGRLHISVPGLEERREELPSLIALLLDRFAAEERVRVPELEDAAVALLWRQTWEDNVRELEDLIYKLVLFHPGARLVTSHVERLARRFGIEFRRRVPSRNPERAIVSDALRTTRTLRGSLNKTRAALYLGWDPDTLTSRMQDLDLDASVLTTRELPKRR